MRISRSGKHLDLVERYRLKTDSFFLAPVSKRGLVPVRQKESVLIQDLRFRPNNFPESPE